ncbi:hypothetical protein A3A05_01875 [Candidatus Nomurabacteria bacterium RIFCSPLOWO2_01_FULL_41_12]|uniref:Uncharacterized protein n=1 Tax=Candidatus Nomurabacteria bacterium RIFCSPLOWO2_01_FULL_41_12 TaxID=1801774 RepID=A0A1F6WWZ9_9BACT|nr:MAG: hypothetical protein A3A05_01875 [Candidatus Nomurabacteria bacterium RIFCSPLOWO2_01_FULL_41_12]
MPPKILWKSNFSFNKHGPWGKSKGPSLKKFMITPELIAYIRGEFAKGRTREEIRTTLGEGGGWSEADLGEAFRVVIPMQSFSQSPLTVKATSSSSWMRTLLIWVAVILFCFAVFGLFRTQINDFWNSAMANLQGFSVPSFGLEKIFSTDKAPAENNTVVKKADSVKDCGNSTAPDPKNPLSYQNNAVLACLGNSAIRCEEAKGVLKDALFPTLFQITKENVKDQNTCNFKLSYTEDSTLVDVSGKKLALQYISCSLSRVSELDESNPESPFFKAPSRDNPSKYASQIYFYGTLGLFIEQELDQNKIRGLGCSGPYIDSVLASYQKMQSQAPK